MDAPRIPLILLVDDDARSGHILARMLREDGYAAELALDGPTAIARLSREPVPDVLVTEMNLPIVDGLTVARYARSRRAAFPVLVVTGYPELARAPHIVGAPPLVFTKPLDYRQLAAALRRSLHVPASRPPSRVRPTARATRDG